MKGIILAGGNGTRLYPATKATCKQLLPVYDKPMIYYPLSILMLAGIRDILIISSAQDLSRFEELFGTGIQLGLRMTYLVQEKPNGIAEAFILGREFIGLDSVCLVLGDNIFYGVGLGALLTKAKAKRDGARVFGYWVKNPEDYGVAEVDADGRVLSIQEKPKMPKSKWAIVGLYFYENSVVDIARNLAPSARGEYEITDINLEFLRRGQLSMEFMGRGFAWLDTGTHDSLLDASIFVRTIEERQGLKVSCIEEIAWRMKFINDDQLMELARPLMASGYGRYLVELLASH